MQKLLIFDWDGTLMNSIEFIVYCVEEAAQDIDMPVPDEAEIQNIIGLGLKDAFAMLWPEGTDKQRDLLAASYREHFFVQEDSSALYPGVVDTLEHCLDLGFQLAVATGKSRRGLDYALEKSGLGKYFVATRCADETESKPHPLMLNELLTHCDLAPSQALMIGDTEYDVMMAHSAQMGAIAVTYGVHHRQRLADCSPKHLIDEISELKKIISPSSD